MGKQTGIFKNGILFSNKRLNSRKLFCRANNDSTAAYRKKAKRHRIANKLLKEKENVGRLKLHNFKISKSYNNQDSEVQAKEQTNR